MFDENVNLKVVVTLRQINIVASQKKYGVSNTKSQLIKFEIQRNIFCGGVRKLNFNFFIKYI